MNQPYFSRIRMRAYVYKCDNQQRKAAPFLIMATSIHKMFVNTNNGDPQVTYDNPQKGHIWSYYPGSFGTVHSTGAVSLTSVWL